MVRTEQGEGLRGTSLMDIGCLWVEVHDSMIPQNDAYGASK